MWAAVLLLLRFHDPAAFRYHLSANLSALNPRVLLPSLLQLSGEVLVRLRLLGRTPTPRRFCQRVSYTLPFKGRWLVVKGGVTPRTSHSWFFIGQRYAYDFVAIDPQGKRHRGNPTLKEDYLSYGQAIVAAADGTVVFVRDGVRDAPQVGTGWVDWLTTDFRGNFVVIKHADAEYTLAAHLIRGSIALHPGDPVRRGQQIGLCGHSGHSTEPHLHFQLQDHSNFFFAASLPVQFANVLVDGVRRTSPVHLTGGFRVEQSTT
jgi:murein DD-endopeptidase MepM/ murein hydrolase activator NlpD